MIRTPVSVIGLGLMGHALAETFLAAGHPTTVWNRSPGKADDLLAKGATGAATVTEAIEASPLVIVCVLDYDAVHALLGPEERALAGKVVVNLTNGRPVEARRSAAWAAGAGAAYLDGGIMAIPPMIGAPDAVILYSGSPEVFEEHRETLQVLGSAVHVGSDPGLAALQDLALLAGMYAMFAGFHHGVGLVGTEKVSAVEFTAKLMPWLNAMVGALPELARAIDAGDDSFEEATLLVNQVGLTNIMLTSREQGMDARLLPPLQAILDQYMAKGQPS